MTSSYQAYLPSALRAQQPEILAPEYAGSVFMMGAQRQTDERSVLGHTHKQTLEPLPSGKLRRATEQEETKVKQRGTKTKLCFLRRFGFVFTDSSI